MGRPARRQRDRTTLVAAFVVAGAILFAAAVRVRIADVPLERDEGEYAYAGQLMLQGIPPYRLAYNMKFPGTYFAYAAMMAVLGETARGIHLGLTIVNAATTVLVFLLGRRLLGGFAGAVAGCAFALLSLDRWILGPFAHATHFVILPALAGALLVARTIEEPSRNRLLAAGACFGLATLMKQHAVFFVAFGMGIAAYGSLRRAPKERTAALKDAGWVAAGAAAPFLLVVGLLAATGVLGRFWFWTFRYASEYATEVPISRAPAELAANFARVTASNLPIWLAGLLGAVLLFLLRQARETRAVLGGLLAASVAALLPGFFFREHYFILLLPATAILVGLAAAATARGLTRWISRSTAAVLVAIACLSLGVAYAAKERAFLFTATPRDVSRQRYGANPFVEAVEVARYIRERAGPGDTIAVLGSEPEIYFYAGRRSATGYIYTYPLMEPQAFASRMQDEMRAEIERAHPAYLVSVQVNTSWLVNARSDRRLLEWAGRYSRECYDLVGVADIETMERTTYVWDAQAPAYVPRSKHVVLTFRRKSDAPCVASR